MKRKPSMLAIRFTVAIVLLGILICTVSSAIGYSQYKANIQKQYNDTAYQVADVASSYLSTNDLKEYISLIEKYKSGKLSAEKLAKSTNTKSYQTTKESLAKLRENMGANDIYIVVPDMDSLLNFNGTTKDWYPISYIFDCYTDEKLSYTLGNQGPINPTYIEDSVKALQTGKRTDCYFISESDYGYNTSALLPISIDGKVVAAIGVEIPMSTIETALRQYVINAIIVTIGLIILFIILYLLYISKKVIKPINAVSNEAKTFVENENEVSYNLKKIKTHDEIQNLAENIMKMQVDINEYINNITSITAEKERIGAELSIATQIQANMLPSIFPAFPDRDEIDVYATMNPAKEVGGDFYDFFMVDDRHLAIVMADVSGKGIPAALFMVIGKTLIKDHTQPNRNLGEVFTEVNNILCESNSEGLFITAFEGVLDLVTGEFNYVNAGHETPYIYKKGNNFEAYKIRPGFVLAGMEDIEYKAGSIKLDIGDKIFQYTDGVTEATNANNELYGSERLNKVLNENIDKSPLELLPVIKSDIDKFVAEAPQFDDITMLCLEYKERMAE